MKAQLTLKTGTTHTFSARHIDVQLEDNMFCVIDVNTHATLLVAPQQDVIEFTTIGKPKPPKAKKPTKSKTETIDIKVDSEQLTALLEQFEQGMVQLREQIAVALQKHERVESRLQSIDAKLTNCGDEINHAAAACHELMTRINALEAKSSLDDEVIGGLTQRVDKLEDHGQGVAELQSRLFDAVTAQNALDTKLELLREKTGHTGVGYGGTAVEKEVATVANVPLVPLPSDAEVMPNSMPVRVSEACREYKNGPCIECGKRTYHSRDCLHFKEVQNSDCQPSDPSA